MSERIVNKVYLLALAIQELHPEWNWMQCTEYAFQLNLARERAGLS